MKDLIFPCCSVIPALKTTVNTGKRSGRNITPVVVSLLLWLAGAAQAANVSLAWDASPDATVTGYRIYCSSSNGTVTIDVGAVLTCTVSNLVGGVTYSFYATAYDAFGVESEPSNTVTYTPPGNSEKPEKPLELRRAGLQRRQPVAELIAHLQGAVSRLFGGGQFRPERYIVRRELAQALGITGGKFVDRFHQSAQGVDFVL